MPISFLTGLLLGLSQLFSGVVTVVGTLGLHVLPERVASPSMVIVLTPLELPGGKIYFLPLFYQMFTASERSASGQQTALIEEMIGNREGWFKAFGYEDKASERFARDQ